MRLDFASFEPAACRDAEGSVREVGLRRLLRLSVWASKDEPRHLG